MFSQKQSYFSKLAKSYPILKLVDVYDRQSFIRAYVLDNMYVCALMHVLFYLALWYATIVIRRMEKSNKQMLKVVEEKRMRLEDVAALKDKKMEYEEVVIKVKEAQKATAIQRENEMRKFSAELIVAANKLSELEKIVEKYKSAGSTFESPAGDVAYREAKLAENIEGSSVPLEDLKILEPSFPPPLPPPRKYGIFVTRPPGQRRPSPAAAAATLPSKLGFK